MRFALLAFAWMLLAPAVLADSEDEIEFLIHSIGASGCDFIRNGKRHESLAAEQHLRTKLKRGRRYVDDAESFIDRLASRSSMSGKPYLVACDGQSPIPARDWLFDKLQKYRAG